MKVILIRHGKTQGNLEHRYVGSTDESLLPEAVEELADKRSLYPEPDVLYVSPLKRCVETAQLLYPDQELKADQNLRECEFGQFEYKNYIELKEDESYQAWIDSGGTMAFPEGESREQFVDRCSQAFLRCCREARESGKEQIGFVVHGGTIMAVLDRFSVPHMDYFNWQVKNAEGFLCELLLDGEQTELTDIRFVL